MQKDTEEGIKFIKKPRSDHSSVMNFASLNELPVCGTG